MRTAIGRLTLSCRQSTSRPLPGKSTIFRVPFSTQQEFEHADEAMREFFWVPRRAALASAINIAATCLLSPLAVAGASISANPRSLAGDWSSPGLATPEGDEGPKFFQTPGGVKVQQLAEGSGEPAAPGDKVLVDFVLRRANGYFIYSTVEGVSFQPRDVPNGAIALTLDTATVPGLTEGLQGMRQGGKRRILVPPQSGYTDLGLEPKMPTFATQRQLNNHRTEPLLFEVELLRIVSRK